MQFNLKSDAEKDIIVESRGEVAQLGERGTRTAEVGGSNPLFSTILSDFVLQPLITVFEDFDYAGRTAGCHNDGK